jgi:hypothetical protein
MEDVLDVYAKPHDPSRPVVCVDEGAPIYAASEWAAGVVPEEPHVAPPGAGVPLPGVADAGSAAADLWLGQDRSDTIPGKLAGP